MASFGNKRKARVIRVEEPDEADAPQDNTSKDQSSDESKPPLFSKVTRKPFRQSGLRKTINVEETTPRDDTTDATGTTPAPPVEAASTTKTAPTVPTPSAADDDEDTGNLVIRPSASRATAKKKRKPAAKLSYDDDADDQHTTPASTSAQDAPAPRKKAGGTGSALKKAIALKDLAMRSRDEDDRPRYSKEYLQELQSSTPNTPQNRSGESSAPGTDGEEMALDELEGAVIVDESGHDTILGGEAARGEETRILTEAEIREKKERRARLAHEEDFISLDDDDDPWAKKRSEKDDTRLVRDDENVFEGFESFVEDGGVALGRKAERDARKKRREEVSSLIREAEGNSDEESDESDAERRAAFEASQSRAGMDGLKRPSATQHPGGAHQELAKPKITPLPSMSECLQTLRESLAAVQRDLAAKSKAVADLRREREEIGVREGEVQRLLDEAGEKYRAAVAGGAGAAGGGVGVGVGGAVSGNGTPARQILQGEAGEFAGERGLESFGTPVVKDRDVDMDGDGEAVGA